MPKADKAQNKSGEQDNVSVISDEAKAKATAAKEARAAKEEAAKPKFKVTKHVTLALLKMTIGHPYYIKIVAAMYEGKVVENSKYDGVPTIMNIVNLAGGQPMELVINAVLGETLREEYPGDKYVGKSFQITKLAKAADKNYHTFELLEIELDEETDARDGL